MIKTEYNRKWYHVFEYCSSCFARNDKHDMNCLECCPVKLGKENSEPYNNQGELEGKKTEAFKKFIQACK